MALSDSQPEGPAWLDELLLHTTELPEGCTWKLDSDGVGDWWLTAHTPDSDKLTYSWNPSGDTLNPGSLVIIDAFGNYSPVLGVESLSHAERVLQAIHIGVVA